MTLKINIVCGEADQGWIYSEFIKQFKKYSKHNILVNEMDEMKFDLCHFIPYYNYFKINKPCTAWFSHMERKDPLKSKFISVARSVDIPISHSKKYADILKNEYGINNVKQIIPGVDLEFFKLRSTKRPPGDKLVVGFVGRAYKSSARKNSKLLKQISELPFVDFRITGGKMKYEDIPKFYADLDIVSSPATIEGGPMSIPQSLACGTPIMCFLDVGVTQEFNVGVIKVDPKDKDNDFLSRLDILWRTKSYMQYRHAGIMNQMRAQVVDKTWERFVLCHNRIWEELVK